MSVSSLFRCVGYCCLVAGMLAPLARAADDKADAAAAAKKVPEISDEPKTVDPATLMPPKLAAKVTVDFSNSSLREVLDWLHEEQGLSVLFDKNAASESGVLLSDPVLDRSNDEPLYLLLNRLQSLGLDWYFENEILRITTPKVVKEHLQLQSYNIGDLLDAGFNADVIQVTVTTAVMPESWENVGGAGVYRTLGDVVFVRQTNDIQRQVQGLFAGLRKHGRQTFTYDPPANLALRQRLKENVSVNFEETPLVDAVKKLAVEANIDLRLDKRALREEGVREREPVTLSLTDRSLETILQSMLLDMQLTWTVQDGVLWVTSARKAEEMVKTAVYDVRDLCRDPRESDALSEAITSQAAPDAWEDAGGPGQLNFPQPGTMVINAQEHLHDDVLELLETYRTALRASKPREREHVDPQEPITLYYRLHSNVAQSLSRLLPQLVVPDTWRNPEHPDAEGTILLVESSPDIEGKDAKLELAVSGPAVDAARTAVISRSVLVIRQTRENHKKIAEVIRRVRSGDATDGASMGSGGFGGGGFGGAYLSPAQDRTPDATTLRSNPAAANPAVPGEAFGDGAHDVKKDGE